jgi:proline dehydrogenase
MQVRQLEDEVGLPLFEKLGKGISLTEAGREIYHYSRSISRALQDMEEIRRQFLSLAKRLMTSGGYHAIATHDPWLIGRVRSFATEQGIGPERFEFQMLFGIRRRLARKTLEEGYRMRIYVPFGRAWVPYTWRRLRERKENMWFVLKHIFVR